MKNISTIKKVLASLTVISVLVGAGGVASAHVTVKPTQVGVAAFQTFTTGVPTEKDVPTTELRVVIPDGLQHVSPNVKPGWKIDTKQTGEGEDAVVTEITWSGGSIPTGQRDEFLFSAQVPAKPTSLNWKAYQTYADGTVVSWDQTPSTKADESSTPYSVTKVVDDLSDQDASATPSNSDDAASKAQRVSNTAIALAVVAIVLSVYTLTRKQKS